MTTEKRYHDRLIRGIDDEHWNILMALARRQGQTIGEYLTVVAEREWERETGQKVGDTKDAVD
jgi:hypothetical protein